MSDNKTKQTEVSVEDFLSQIRDTQKQADCRVICQMMQEVTGEPPKMWGPSIIGFGKYHYKYESGREGDSCITGVSPRAQAITLYLSYDFEDKQALMDKLGKHTAGKACVYIKRLSDVDQPTLKKMIANSVKQVKTNKHV
jgi:hypothetical protein